MNPDAFLGELALRKAVPFAIKPLTLHLLLKRFQRDGRLPDRIEEIYLEGCRSLCAEVNPSRIAAGQTGKLSTDQRLAVAGRLAALTLFTGRTAILHGANSTELIEGDLLSQEALGGDEEENNQKVEITPEAIRETLDTGFFTTRGPSRLGWAHQTYADFLAAWYVVRHGFDAAQKISLITHAEQNSHLVIPQLVQTAVWLVNLDPPLFAELVKDSPHVLIRSEADAWSEYQKSELTASLLKLVAELKLTDTEAELWRSFSKLSHPDLASQLEPYIRDRAANPVVRRVAIGITEACRLTELREFLLALALDKTEDHPTRVQAIRALRGIGELETRQRLLMLLFTDLQEDDDDQIRGAVLSQVWPDLLSFEELSQHLTEPKSSLIGAYWNFLKYELVRGLRSGEFPQALMWAHQQEGRRSTLSPLHAAADQIVKAACRQADEPSILFPLVEALTTRLEAGHSLWDDNLFDEEDDNPLKEAERRHLLIRSIVERTSDAQSLSSLGIIRRFQENDFAWLLQQVLTDPTGAGQKKWVLLVRELFITDVDHYWDQVFEASRESPILAESFTPWLGPIALDSPEADWQRKEWQWTQQAAATKKEERSPLSTLLQEVHLALQDIEAGAQNAWPRIAALLGNVQQREWDTDIRRYQIWEQLDKEHRSAVIQAAQQHILEGEDPGDGKMSRSFNYGELASFRALYLVIAETPDFYTHLGQDIVRKWVPLILKKPGIVNNAEPYERLLRLASQTESDLVAQKISQAIDQQNRTATDEQRPNLDLQLRECWDDRIEQLLLEKLKSGEFKPHFTEYLLDSLLSRESEQARQWALQLLQGPIPSDLADQEKQLRVALSLLFVEDHAWSTAWNRITALAALQGTLARQAVDQMHYEFDQARLTNLTGPQLGEICVWLKQTLPAPAQSQGGFLADWRDNAEVFRGLLFSHLQKAGTPKALAALRYVARQLPDDVGAKWMLAEAQKASLQHTWIPPAPTTILKMARRPDTRLVHSGEQLLTVVMESLDRLQKKLHGHTPGVDFLWNKATDQNSKRLWPQDENTLSNYVKSHLEDDLQGRGIILNREVEIRQSLGKSIRQGQETDIQVDAIVQNTRSGEPQRVSVIIEVKGCWNRELKTAMKEQLAERYLAESQCQHGIYLVGWFLCEAWDANDYRKSDTPKWALQEAREHFLQQETEFSQGGLLIRSFVLDATLR